MYLPTNSGAALLRRLLHEQKWGFSFIWSSTAQCYCKMKLIVVIVLLYVTVQAQSDDCDSGFCSCSYSIVSCRLLWRLPNLRNSRIVQTLIILSGDMSDIALLSREKFPRLKNLVLRNTKYITCDSLTELRNRWPELLINTDATVATCTTTTETPETTAHIITSQSTRGMETTAITADSIISTFAWTTTATASGSS